MLSRIAAAVIVFTAMLFGAGQVQAQLVTDSFSGSGSLGANWTNLGTTTCAKSSGNVAPSTAGGKCTAIYTGTTLPTSEFAELTVTSTTCSTGSQSTGPVLVDASQNGYIYLACPHGLYVLSGGAGVGPVGGYGSCPTTASGDRIRIERTGNTLRCLNLTSGQSFSATDSTYTGALYAGMVVDQTAGGGDSVASFRAGAYTTVSTSTVMVTTNSTGNAIILTGTNTSWTAGTPGSPTFTVTNSGGSSCSITGQTVNSSTSATITLSAGSTQGTCTINDPSTLNSVSLTVHSPQIWYIGLNGGTATQCTGHTNAAYPGSGTGQACALNHPFWLMAVGSAPAWRSDYGGGDTVQFVDEGPYYYGEKNGSYGYDWNGAGINTGGCGAPNTISYNCHLPDLPSGSATQPTRWLGKNAGACHTMLTGTANPNRFNLNNPTQLIAINGAYFGLSLQGSSYTDVECLQVTSRVSCSASGDTPAILGTSKTGTTATYQWNDSSWGSPLVGQRVNVTGTTNGSGIFNGTNLVVSSVTGTTLNITAAQSDGTTATFTYTLASGIAPRNNDHIIISGTTNCGGALNGIFGIPISNVTGTTFQVAWSSASCASASQSGQATDISSGLFTIDGFASGTVTLASESGQEVPYGKCGASTTGNDYGAYGIVFQFQTSQGPSNFTLKDIGTEGMINSGVIGSHINQSASDTSTASFFKIMGNASAGWNADGGGCGTSCESVGTLNMDHVMMDFNGCTEVFPNGGYSTTTGMPLNGFNYCYAQQTGGYGDGFVQVADGDFNLNLSYSEAMFNTQDGYDLLHLGDDGTHNQNLTIHHNWAEGNMGQTYKIGGSANVSVYDNVSISNCKAMAFGTASYLSGFPSGWNAGAKSGGDYCRAYGDQWVINPNDGKTISMTHNTSVGYGATMYDINCGTCTGSETFIFRDNISVGYLYDESGQNAGGFYYGSINPFTGSASAIDHNLWYNMRGNTCPQDSHETNYQCGDPKLTSESNIDAIDPRLTSASTLAIGKGVAAGSTTDFAGASFASTPSIGALEYATGATVASVSIAPSPAAVTIGSTVPLVATCTYTDSSTSDCTLLVTWSNLSSSFFTVSSTGTLTGSALGSGTVQATINSQTATATVNVTAVATSGVVGGWVVVGGKVF